jgi:hypothetical protein
MFNVSKNGAISQLLSLKGHYINNWIGHEMAISDSNNSGDVLWHDKSVPYLQFGRIDIHIESGKIVSLLSQLDDGSNWFGLYLAEFSDCLVPGNYEKGSIYDVRQIDELPLGVIKNIVIKEVEGNNPIKILIEIGENVISFFSGEVYAESQGYKICSPDECILIQIR